MIQKTLYLIPFLYDFASNNVTLLIISEHRTMPLKSGPLPTFADIELSNHTARVGNEVSFACTVKNLGNYKVLQIFHFFIW